MDAVIHKSMFVNWERARPEETKVRLRDII